MSKRVIGHPGHVLELEDLKTLEQTWVRYLRVNNKIWVRDMTRLIRSKLVFFFGSHPEAKVFAVRKYCLSYNKGDPPPKVVCTWEVWMYGGAPRMYTYIYIYTYSSLSVLTCKYMPICTYIYIYTRSYVRL